MSANEYVVINGKRYAAMAGVGAETSSGESAVLVVAELQAPKLYTVTPTIAGVATTERLLTAAASNAVLSARCAFNALDLVTAGTNIKNRYPDIKSVEIDEVVTIQSDTAITSIYITGISSAANVGGDVIDIAETDEALIRAEIIQFDFEAGDIVKTVEISLGSKNNALSGATVPTPLTATLRVEGFSHA